MERDAKLNKQTNSPKKFLTNMQHQKSENDTWMKPMTTSKRCLLNKLDSPAKRIKHSNFSNILQFTECDYVTSEQNLDTTVGQLVDSGGGGTEMESKSFV